ncbi:hypothetical protein GCM10023087_07610 [Microbacterium rhizosphaerae]
MTQALACAGMTAIRKANYGHPGRMYEAFFGLSQAIERLGKLIIVAERYAVMGSYPAADEIKNQYGHNLKRILRDAESVATDRHIELVDAPSLNPGSKAVVAFLTKFANADRYFNIGRLAHGDSLTIDDPVSRWPQLVRAHAPAPRVNAARDARIARQIDMSRALDQHVPAAIINGVSLSGENLHSFESLTAQSHEDERLSVEGMLLALRPLRFLSKTIGSFDQARYPLPMFSDFFWEWKLPDSQLRRRRQFPRRR